MTKMPFFLAPLFCSFLIITACSGTDSQSPPYVPVMQVGDQGACTWSNNTWQGFANTWVNDDAVISPADYSAVLAGDTLAASGTVDADPTDSSNDAGIIFDLNNVGGVHGSVTPAETGIVLRIVNTGRAGFVLYLESDSSGRWGYASDANGELRIPYTSFVTEPWTGGSHTAYVPGTSIGYINLHFPCKASSEVSFDVKVTDLYEY